MNSKLFTFEFIALNAILMVAFCNVSVFYSFFHYLDNIGIHPGWRGFLTGLEPMTAFALRLFIIPLIGPKDATRLIMGSLMMMVVTSCAYPWAVTVPALVVLRIFHGAVFVLLTSAIMVLIVMFIPKEKSGQGFGTISVAAMIPYAVVPPATEILLPHVASEAIIYAGFSIFAILAIGLIALVRQRIENALADMEGALMRRPYISEIRNNLGNRQVMMLLLITLMMYLCHATVFYFMKDLSIQNRIGSTGYFFTICMAAMIAVRTLGGPAFDKTDRTNTLMAGFIFLSMCFILFSRTDNSLFFYCLAGCYGLSVGIILPQINALIFSFSAPGLRGMNTNLGLFVMDMGYFITPYLGGAILELNARYAVLFDAGAGLALLSLALTAVLKCMGTNQNAAA